LTFGRNRYGSEIFESRRFFHVIGNASFTRTISHCRLIENWHPSDDRLGSVRGDFCHSLTTSTPVYVWQSKVLESNHRDFGCAAHRLRARGFGSHHQDKNQLFFGDLQTLQREGLEEENRFATWCLSGKRFDSLFLFLPLDPPLIDDFDAINLALACFVAGKSFLVPSRSMRECFWSCRAFFQKLLEEDGATVGNLRFRVPNIGAFS